MKATVESRGAKWVHTITNASGAVFTRKSKTAYMACVVWTWTGKPSAVFFDNVSWHKSRENADKYASEAGEGWEVVVVEVTA